ncbi:hypothetical protein VSDG_05657 [Cytospora chrysosperma]|uniref:Uncharacterized protein n=1 Tax=Cytospora chrysosperma TaxID=252740 RepID=A0A423VSX2_CYTCH|nr:hypothetical protein VSDG_05657 [Valsa sordida]
MADAFRPNRGDMIVEGDKTELCQTTPPLLELPLKAKHTRTSKPIAKTQVRMGCDDCKD